jgi:hypothetical protein
MEQPLIKSLSNLQNLYLKYPSDEAIQQPKSSLNSLHTNNFYQSATINNEI